MPKPKFIIIDIDGVLSTGSFLYNNKGKSHKIFGPDDNEALKILKNYAAIIFITADKRGFEISKKRVQDMGFSCHLVDSKKRLNWIQKKFDLNLTIYIGDGIYDFLVFQKVFYSIAMSDSFFLSKKYASYITKHLGGKRGLAEASLHILKKFYFKGSLEKLLKGSIWVHYVALGLWARTALIA